MPRVHTHTHPDPTHHIGPCDEACYAGLRAHRHRLPSELGGGMGEFHRGKYGTVFVGRQGGPSPSYVRRQARRHREFRIGKRPSEYAAPRRRRAVLPPKLRVRARAVKAGRVRRTSKGRFKKG